MTVDMNSVYDIQFFD